MKNIDELKRLATFAKEHGVFHLEMDANGEVTKLLFMHKHEQKQVPVTFDKKATSEDEDDLFYSVDIRPKFKEKK